MVTGESVPVEVDPGDPVIGATVKAGGRLVVEANPRRRRHTTRPDGRLVEHGQNRKAQAQRLADRI